MHVCFQATLSVGQMDFPVHGLCVLDENDALFFPHVLFEIQSLVFLASVRRGLEALPGPDEFLSCRTLFIYTSKATSQAASA